MTPRPRALVAALAFATVLCWSAAAEGCVPSTSDPEVTFGEYYADNDDCVRANPDGHLAVWHNDGAIVEADCLLSLWLYEESNGIAGLQRGDEVVDDTCGGLILSDTLPG